MAIQRLSESAIRAIRSCQTLTESSSLVKELMDNALDADATSIAVEISANSLDVVQVKDNGHGIEPEGRDAMAVRYSTSKIRDLQELKNLGGQSLGFRGEALSAARQMAEKMVITTRVEGECVAEACWIDRNGSIETRERASHPIGTTVRILDFLRASPVRRENALKNSGKTLTKIRRLMQAYALARADIRFSLKILKSGKGNWSYVPRKTTPQLDLSLVIGKEAAGQCIWLSYPLPPTRDDGGGVRRSAYSIEAFAPKPGADLSKISGKGQFVSIDSRPVSCARGTLKQISFQYRNYLRSANPEGAVDKLVDPFICMNIVCPPGSYDVNIEPAKDDVLFGDPGAVLSVVEDFLQSVYGDLTQRALDSRSLKSKDRQRNGFEILPARKSYQIEQNRDAIVQNIHNKEASVRRTIITANNLFPPLGTPHMNNASINATDRPGTGPGSSSRDDCSSFSSKIQSPWKFNMYRDADSDDEDIPPGQNIHDEAVLAEAQAQDMEENSSAVASNPWTIAKMNSPAHTVHRGPPVGFSDKQSKPNTQTRTPARAPDFCQPGVRGSLSKGTPTLSSLSSSSRLEHERSEQNSNFAALNEGGGLSGATGIDTQDQRSRTQLGPSIPEDPSGTAVAAGTTGSEETTSIQAQPHPYCQPKGFDLTRTPAPIGPPTNGFRQTPPAIPGISKQRKQGVLNTPCVSLTPNDSHNWTQFGPSRGGKQLRPQAVSDSIEPSVSLAFGTNSDDLIEEPSPGRVAPVHPEIGKLLDCRRRKLQATRQKQAMHEAEAGGGGPNSNDTTSLTPSPYNNRYQAAKAVLAGTPSHFESGDPRGYLTCLAQSNPNGTAMPQPRRARTMMLPLETVPIAYRVHSLSTIIRTTSTSVERIEKAVAFSDAYVVFGKVVYAFPPDTEEVPDVEAALRESIYGIYQDKMGGIVDIDLKISTRDDLEI
ncbi:hypothetical protein FGG08_006389 [Glutinoglossum americanum]|uniref:DNA mismatch repair protein S5 domain-containing protein n=1 Tax=Glutinoglossum americanum TaxID=1670608 RepID=A0A9P8HW51_9PEZI|nr:hypothetical protein FGG08_006389 [Glutinoglossum americanum]